jgi:hypothetical protein
MLKSLSRNLTLISLFALTVLVAMFFVTAEHYRARNQELKKSRSVVAGTKVLENKESKEESYAHPIPIHVHGRIITSFAGGFDLAVESAVAIQGHSKFYIVGYSDLDYSDWQGELVDIDGAMIGTTCAYANTVFGLCVPEIMASSISKVAK